MMATRRFPTHDALLVLGTAEQLQLSAASFALFWRHAVQTPNPDKAAERNVEHFRAVRSGGVGAEAGICARFLCGANV